MILTEEAMTAANTTRITWLGHSAVLIQTAKGTNILIDPYLTGNPSYPKGFELPAKIDYILLTHGHGDHLGDAVPLAAKYGATVVAIFELAEYVAKKGAAKTVGMNLGGTVQLKDVAATMVDARHSAAAVDEKGVHYVGVAAGFVLTIEGGTTIYHAGDTAVFGDMALIRELYEPKVALLPIGDHFTMGLKEAALAVQLIAPEVVLPMHWGTFPILTGTPAGLAAMVPAGVKVVDWKPGDAFTA
jgi:L-ascorbate metabolism protein UlaG (beta-lactamase superfamily)